MTEKTYWRRCSTCKSQLDYGQKYWVCNVSTCNRKRTGLVFCSVECWDAHLPIMNHREAWAEERTAPAATASPAAPAAAASPAAPAADAAPDSSTAAAAKPAGTRRFVRNNSVSLAPNTKHSDEVLVVASKVKSFVKEQADMNTSASVMQALSLLVRRHCAAAIEKARAEGRKTLMDRDFDI